MNTRQSRQRKEIFRTLLITTVIVLLLLGAAFLLSRILPVWKQQRVDSALSSGDTAFARKLAEDYVGDERLQILQQCSYIDAQIQESQGHYPEASALFAEAGNYEDAPERRKNCDYLYASLLEENEQWDEAVEVFRSLGGYRDAADRISECHYKKALRLIENGEKWEAAEVLDQLTGMEKAHSLLVEIVMELTGYDEERALSAFHGMSEEQLALLSDLSELREALPHDIIDVGFAHTVGLGADGHVYACGDNSCGQCDTSAWKNAVAVAAGAWHTVALLSDGTVVAAGRNSEAQCETTDWNHIVQIAAGDYATFALTADGTVLSTGFLDYEEVRDWSSITSIRAGSYGVAGIRSDGSLWFYPEMAGASLLQNNVEDLVINTGFAAAVYRDGSTSCTAMELPAWKNVLALSASGTAIVALESGGFADAVFFRESDRIDFSSVIDAVAVAAGGTHFAFVFSDGSVRVFGCSEHGEADTGGWSLAVG